MLYKYDKKALSREIQELNSTGFTKVIKCDQKSLCLEILFFSSKSNVEICFYMDISPYNNYFQKKISKIINKGLFDISKLNILTNSFCESYIPEKHNQLKDFFLLLKDHLEANLEKKIKIIIKMVYQKIYYIFIIKLKIHQKIKFSLYHYLFIFLPY
jgi:hypothetical protein